MTVKLKNNVAATLSAAISATDVGLVVTSGQGARFPTLGAGEYFYGTLISTTGIIEIVKVTARVSDAMTIVRAQEDTAAANFAAGSRFEIRVTAQSVIDAVTDTTTSIATSVATTVSAAAVADKVYTSGLGASDNRVVRTDGTDTKKAQGSLVSIDDSGNIATPGYIDVVEQAEPASPAANTARFYAHDVSGITKLSYKDASGVVTTIGSYNTQAVSVFDYIPRSEHADIQAYTSTTDVSSYIQAAHDALDPDGGAIYFPPGKYRVGSAITFSKQGAYFSDGIGAVIIETSSATANIFNITGQFIELRGFKFVSSVTRSGGVYVNVTGNRIYVRDFWMESGWVGIATSGTSVTIESGWMLDMVPTNAVGVLITGGADVTIRDLTMDAAAQIDAGVRVVHALDVTIEDSNIVRSGKALHLLPSTGQVIASLWANNCFFDTSVYGALFDSTGGSIVRCIFDQCWFSSATNAGATLSKSSGSGILDGIEFNDCQFLANGSNGLLIFNPSWQNISINGGIFAGNVGDGISIPANTSKFWIRGARVGASHDFAGNANGIVIAAGTSDYYIIDSCDLTGNSGSALIDGGTGTNKRITGNLPATSDPAWVSYTPVITPLTGAFTTVSATGKYFNLGGGAVAVSMTIQITTNGTAAGGVFASLPFIAASSAVFAGRETAVTGTMLQGLVYAAQDSISISTYGNAYPAANGYTFVLNGVYET